MIAVRGDGNMKVKVKLQCVFLRVQFRVDAAFYVFLRDAIVVATSGFFSTSDGSIFPIPSGRNAASESTLSSAS